MKKTLMTVFLAIALSALSLMAETKNRGTVAANSSVVWNFFELDEDDVITVYVNGDGSTTLSVSVYDCHGNLVRSAHGEHPSFKFVADGRKYAIKIRNRGDEYNDYVLRTW